MGGKRPGGNYRSISRREDYIPSEDNPPPTEHQSREDYIPSDDNPPPTEHQSREDYITSNDKRPPANQHHFSQFW